MKSRIHIALIAFSVILSLLGASFYYMHARRDLEVQVFGELEREGELLAAAASDEGFRDLAQAMDRIGTQSLVMDDPGHLTWSSAGAPVDLTSRPAFQELVKAGGTATLLSDQGAWHTLVRPRIDGSRLILTRSTAALAPLLADLRYAVLLVSLGLMILAGVATLFLTRMLLSPLEQLTEATAHIASGELSYRIALNDLEDLAPIADHFNGLADRLEGTILDSLNHQNQLDAILGSMNSGVVAVDQNDRILIFNAFARGIFGVWTEAIGRNIRDVIKTTDLEELMQVSDEFRELSLHRATNTVVRYKTTELITDRNFHRGKVTVIQDVTDLKKLETMRSQFVANVSHELKTPLTSIKGFAETLRDVDDPIVRKKFLDIIDNEAERLSRLIEDILSLSAIENQERKARDLIDAGEATASVLHLFEVQARDRNVELSLLIKGEPQFIGDDDMYREMVINLVDNAIKYTDSGGRVKLRLEEGEDVITLTVQDTGAGIPAEHLPRLFERFYRVDKSRDRAKGGTGLGLAIVKHIVLSFGGHIAVDSKVGEGTTFTVQLPAQRDEGTNAGTRIQVVKLNG